MAKMKLDKEEKDLLDSYERGEWRSVKNLKQEIQKHKEYARQTLKKDKRVNIRISSMVLDELQTRAVEDGMTERQRQEANRRIMHPLHISMHRSGGYWIA